MAVTFELHPREPKAEQCWIYVQGQLVEKCATADKVARLAAYGRTMKRRGGFHGGYSKEGAR